MEEGEVFCLAAAYAMFLSSKFNLLLFTVRCARSCCCIFGTSSMLCNFMWGTGENRKKNVVLGKAKGVEWKGEDYLCECEWKNHNNIITMFQKAMNTHLILIIVLKEREKGGEEPAPVKQPNEMSPRKKTDKRNKNRERHARLSS
jgi:hypothetical protein